ncbi:MAG: RHS repeat-associated core domain-containing protein [Verrucomicrobiia bacterium]
MTVFLFAQSLRVTAFTPSDPIPEIPVTGQGPVVKNYPIAGSGSFALFSYDMHDRRDRMQVRINEGLVLDTGMVEGKGKLGFEIPEGLANALLTVIVNTDEDDPDPWEYTIHMNPPFSDGVKEAILDDTKDRLESLYGDPVDMATGGQVMRQNLFTLQGAQPLAFTIDYHSLLGYNGPLGRGWSHNYETRLERLEDGSICIHWNQKRFNTFVVGEQKSKNKKEKRAGDYQAQEPAARFYQLQPNANNTYTLIDRQSKAQWRFDSKGQLSAVENAMGQSLNLSYNPSNQLSAIQEPISGKQLNFTYNPYGKVIQISDPSTGRKVSLGYDNGDLLTNMVLVNGNSITYTYNKMGQILSGQDSQGQLFVNTYDEQGRIIAQDDGRVETPLTHFVYLSRRLKKKELKKLFQEEDAESVFNSFANETSTNEEVSKGKHKKRIEQTTLVLDRNHQVHLYRHNDKFQLLSYTDPENRVTRYRYDREGNRRSILYPGHRRVRCDYDVNNRMIGIQFPGFDSLKMEYDSQNNLISKSVGKNRTHKFDYDEMNCLTRYTDPLGNSYQLVHTADGLLQQITKPGGGTATYTYAKGRPSQIKDLSGNLWSFTYDLAGRLATLMDPEGHSTTYTYDPKDRITSIKDPLGNQTVYQYDLRSKLTKITDAQGAITTLTYTPQKKLASITDAQTNTTTFLYDNEDRLISAIDPLGNTTQYEYDKIGRRIATVDPLGNRYIHHYNEAGNLTETIDPLKNRQYQLQYNRQNQITRIKTIDKEQQNNHYNKQGLLTAQNSGAGRRSHFEYDAMNRLVQTKNSAKQQAQQAFDVDSNLSSLTDSENHTTRLSYDKAGQLTSLKTPSGQTMAYTYNSRNLIESVVWPSEQKVNFTYDAAGQLKTLTEEDGDTSFTYDKVGRPLTITKDGKTITRKYDKLGQLIRFTDASGNVLNYVYDAVGRLTQLTYPDGKTVAYNYDANSRLTTVTDWNGRVTKYTYDEVGRLIETQRPNGSKETRTYGKESNASLLKQLTDISTGKTLIDYRYDYNRNGQLSQQQGEPETPEYSLTQPIEMSYDADNRLVSYNSQTLEYDSNGNLLNGPFGAYAYDSRNRLTSAGDLTYTYDAENRRIAIEDANGVTQLVQNPNAFLSQLLVRKTPDGKETYYVYGLGLLYQESEDQVYYYHYDRQGNTLFLTDQNGQITDQFAYSSYGETIKRQGTTDTPFQYNGYWGIMTDSNGLLQMRVRYYSPELKRFLNQDSLLGSIDNPLSLNRFAYVNGDPINYTDPFGLFPVTISLPNPLDWIRGRERRREDRHGGGFLGFDERGEEILDHWLNGSGETMVRNNGNWRSYMMDNDLLRRQIVAQLQRDANTRNASGAVNIQFNAEIENGYKTGYEMLHGTHHGEGAFQIHGIAIKSQDGQIHYRLRYSWNDVIDPNPKYGMDSILSGILGLIYDPEDYAIHIRWDALSDIIFSNGKIIETGYPFEDK